MGRLRTSLFVAGAALVVGAAAGSSVAAVVIPAPVPAALGAGHDLGTMMPTVAEFDDPHDVRVTVTLGGEEGVRAPRGGVVTALACAPGGVLASGGSPASIDGRAVVALATAIPPWRDIAVGDEGDDVASLETELARLGAGVEVDGRWSWSDALAFDAALVVTTDESGTVQLGSIAWLPAATVTAAECPTTLGETVAAGATLVGLVPRPTVAKAATAVDAVPGDRVLRVSSGDIPVAADGSVADPAALAGSTEFASADPGQQPLTLTASWVLVTPVRVTVVAPSALVAVDGDRACVVGPRGAVPVRIVASQLGRTLVAPQTPLVDIRLHPDPGTVCP